MPVSDIPDEELLKRAVRCARDYSKRRGEAHPRWVGVKWAFGLGSSYAVQLCDRFGLDPDENVKV